MAIQENQFSVYSYFHVHRDHTISEFTKNLILLSGQKVWQIKQTLKWLLHFEQLLNILPSAADLFATKFIKNL